jgi:hypothetical protein
MGARRVVETLTRTGGFGTNVTRHRLMETFQHILQVTRSLESVQPGGDGFSSSLRVRLLHASVRRRILQLAAAKPDYYSVLDYGVPVNDLDSIGTVATFSATLTWIGLPRQGILMRADEIEDYVALWRWVAHLLGTPTEPFATPARAKAIMESLLASEMAPTATGAVLAANIITGLHNQPPTYVSRKFLHAQTHWLNGRELADALKIPRPTVYYQGLMLGQCIFFAALTYWYRLMPSRDEKRIEVRSGLSLRLSWAFLGSNIICMRPARVRLMSFTFSTCTAPWIRHHHNYVRQRAIPNIASSHCIPQWNIP